MLLACSIALTLSHLLLSVVTNEIDLVDVRVHDLLDLRYGVMLPLRAMDPLLSRFPKLFLQLGTTLNQLHSGRGLSFIGAQLDWKRWRSKLVSESSTRTPIFHVSVHPSQQDNLR